MRANQKPPKRIRPAALKRIKAGKRPPCTRCNRHPAMTGRTICVSCRDRVSQDHPPRPDQIIPIPREPRRSYSARENTTQTKYGEETT